MKILVIEDEKGIANFLKQGLEEEGYEVLIANDGKSGYELALIHKTDIILLDWVLPEMSGIEVCNLIRKTDIKTPIIFLHFYYFWYLFQILYIFLNYFQHSTTRWPLSRVLVYS